MEISFTRITTSKSLMVCRTILSAVIIPMACPSIHSGLLGLQKPRSLHDLRPGHGYDQPELCVKPANVYHCYHGDRDGPVIELEPVSTPLTYDGTQQTIDLAANAFDPDGKVIEVRFYGNGELLGIDDTTLTKELHD